MGKLQDPINCTILRAISYSICAKKVNATQLYYCRNLLLEHLCVASKCGTSTQLATGMTLIVVHSHSQKTDTQIETYTYSINSHEKYINEHFRTMWKEYHRISLFHNILHNYFRGLHNDVRWSNLHPVNLVKQLEQFGLNIDGDTILQLMDRVSSVLRGLHIQIHPIENALLLRFRRIYLQKLIVLLL